MHFRGFPKMCLSESFIGLMTLPNRCKYFMPQNLSPYIFEWLVLLLYFSFYSNSSLFQYIYLLLKLIGQPNQTHLSTQSSDFLILSFLRLGNPVKYAIKQIDSYFYHYPQETIVCYLVCITSIQWPQAVISNLHWLKLDELNLNLMN